MSNAPIRITALALTLGLSATSTALAEDPLPQGPKLRLGTTRYRDTWSHSRGLLHTPPTLSPDGRTLALSKERREIALMDASTGKVTRKVRLESGRGARLEYLADGKSMPIPPVFGGGLSFLDLESGKCSPAGEIEKDFYHREWSISASGTRVAVVRRYVVSEGTAKEIPVAVWSLPDKKSTCVVKAIQNEFVRVHFSADGKVMATWGRYKPPGNSRRGDDRQELTVQVWDTDTGSERCRVIVGGGWHPTDPDGFVVTAALSPDGKRLATAALQVGGIELYDSASGKLIQRFISRGAPVKKLVYSPDGTHLAALGFDGGVQLWDLKTGIRLGVVESPVGDVAGVVFPEAGRAIAWAMDGRTAVLWEVPSGKHLHIPEGHTDTVTSIVFSADGRRVTTAGADHIIAEWDTTNGKMLSSTRLELPERARPEHLKPPLEPGWGRPDIAALSPDGKRVVVAANGTRHSEVLVFDRASGTELLGFKTMGGTDYPYPPLFTSDSSRLFYPPTAIGTTRVGEAVVPIWEIGSGRSLGEVVIQQWSNHPFQHAFSPDGTRIVTLAYHRNIDTRTNTFLLASWDTKTGAKLAEWEMNGPLHIIGSIAVAPDNRTAVVSVIHDSLQPKFQLFAWDVTTGKVIKEFPASGSLFLAGSLVVSPDGKTFAGVGRRGERNAILVCDLSSGEIRHELVGSGEQVTALAFSPDGKTLASGSQDTTVLLWDLSAVGK
jgi:WD40 repeat protein